MNNQPILNTNYFKPLVGVIFILLLAGCAGQVNMLPTLTPETIVQPSQGVVVVRIINTSSYPLPFNQITFAPENLMESSKIKADRALSLTPKMNGSTVFSAPINAGKYALSSIRSFHARGDYLYSRWASTDAKFGTFVIEPGKVTDLGTIIYYPKPEKDKYFDILLLAPHTQKGEVLDSDFSFFKYDKDQLLGWNLDERDEERESLYSSVAQNPITFNSRYLAPDGAVYFLGKLGVILKRTAQGDWELDAIDSNFDLNTMAQNKRGDIIVGGAEGQLFLKTVGNEWKNISLDPKNQVEQLFFYDEDRVDMISKTTLELSISRANITQQNVEWRELNQFSSQKLWYNSLSKEPTSSKRSKPKTKRISHANISQVGMSHFISISMQSLDANPAFFDGTTEIFGYNPDNWQVYEPELAPEFTLIVNAGATKVGITEAGFWSWSGRPTYKKYNQESDSWSEIVTVAYKCKDGPLAYSQSCKTDKKNKEIFNFRSVPLFKNAQDVVAIVSFSDFNFWSGQRSSETKILTSNDGGTSWEDTGNELPVKYCATIVTEVADRLLISCDGVTGDFYESFDNGANWEHVRQHENF
jgi:hypothetical protein